MAANEFPLRTNYELTRILNMYNGSNEIEISEINEERTKYSWFENKQDNSMSKTDTIKSLAPHNYTIKKCSAYITAHRGFVEYAIRDRRALDLLKWAEDAYSPDEMLFWVSISLDFIFELHISNVFKKGFGVPYSTIHNITSKVALQVIHRYCDNLDTTTCTIK